MKLSLYWVDAFASQLFRGNPAAVGPLEQWPDDHLMQPIAFKNGLAETAFVPVAPGHYHLRWFTPKAEVNLCGHATVATAFTLFTQLGFAGSRLVFDSRSGQLPVQRLPDGRIELDFPSRPARALPVAANSGEPVGDRVRIAGHATLYLQGQTMT